jgi:hypothetical protein
MQICESLKLNNFISSNNLIYKSRKFILTLVGAFVTIHVLDKLAAYLSDGKIKCKRRLDGKTVIITGAHKSIGKETALELARRGARVIIASEDTNKASRTALEIIARTGNPQIIVHELDFFSLQSVRVFAQRILTSEPRIDILINNNS